MFQSYSDIEYDEKTRRTNRIMKVLGGIIAILIVGGLAAAVAAIEDSTSDGPLLDNDTRGTVACYGRFRNFSDEIYVKETGRLGPNESTRLANISSCAVFDDDGDYVGCLIVRGGEDEQFSASKADRRVKADRCVYPR